MRRTVRAALYGVFGLGILTLVTGQAVAGPTTEFTVTGDVVSPATYDLAGLGSLPPTTETVTFQTMTGPQTTSFTGPTLWTLLNTVGLRTPAVKNGILRQYVVAQGSDGYTSLFSLGELAPQFGGSNPQVLVADQQNGAPLGSTGFARIVAAKDNFGGRYVSNLANLKIGTAPSNPSQGGGTTTQLSLSGAVQTPGVYTLSSLEAAAWADVIVNIPALQDATLFSGSAANNSSSGPGMFVGSDGQSHPKRGLIEFDIPPICHPMRRLPAPH